MNIWDYSETEYFPPRTSRFWKWYFFKTGNCYKFTHVDQETTCYSIQRLEKLIADIGTLKIEGFEYYGIVHWGLINGGKYYYNICYELL